MVKHQAWATTIVAPKLVDDWVYDCEKTDETNLQGEFSGVPGQREQPNQCPQTYNCIQYSKSSEEISGEEQLTRDPPLNLWSSRTRATRFQIQNRHNTDFDLESFGLKTKELSNLIHKVPLSKTLLKSSWIELRQIRKLKAH